jgi:phosphoglycerol transferase MdoB-like AlkP superfamily enzyme
MYDRRAIYPAMGFRRAWFDADLRRAAPSIRPCPGTAFGGVCDADLFTRALSLFDGHRRFVHVLTLDAHLPLPEEGSPICEPSFAGNAGLCRYAQVTQASLGALGRAVMVAHQQPDLIIIYGDHAPPFAATAAREQFAPHRVPYIVFVKRRVTA